MVNKGCLISIFFLVYSVIPSMMIDGALTDEEIKAEFTKLLLRCSEKFHVNMKDLMALATLKVPTDPEVRCILACAYREVGSLNDKGLYDLEGALKYVDLTLKGDDARLKKGKEFANECSAVNVEKVNDGEKGCDRAALMFKCTVNNAAKYGFKV